jgi:predicted nucleotidyltransferase
MSNRCEPPPTRTKDDLKLWARRLAARFDDVNEVYLVGSRARGQQHKNSDYDVAIRLRPECYDQQGNQINKIEQRIAFDDESWFKGLDVFFVGPTDVRPLHKWTWGPDESFDDIKDEEYELYQSSREDDFRQRLGRSWRRSRRQEFEERVNCLCFGEINGDMSKFFEDWKFRRLLFQRAGRKTE